MGKTIVKAMMAGLESFVQFVTGGRIFVCAVLALLFLPITLGVLTFLVVLLPIWYGLHVHLAVGAAVAGVMLMLAYRNTCCDTVGPKYTFRCKAYGYEPKKNSWGEMVYEFMATDTYKSCDYCILRAPYVFLLKVHIAIAIALFKRRWPLRSSEPNSWVCDDEDVYLVLTGIAWSWPANIALGLGVLATLIYFVNTLIFGGAETVVSDIIHGPWLYLVGSFGR